MGEKRRRVIFLSAAILLIVFAAFTVTGCSAEGKGSALASSFEFYDEEAFVKEMATSGDNKILFAEGGNSAFSVIVYPYGLTVSRDDAELQ